MKSSWDWNCHVWHSNLVCTTNRFSCKQAPKRFSCWWKQNNLPSLKITLLGCKTNQLWSSQASASNSRVYRFRSSKHGCTQGKPQSWKENSIAKLTMRQHDCNSGILDMNIYSNTSVMLFLTWQFYRWISERYPQINQVITDSALLPEFDHLYLDMNGIIHGCTHPTHLDISEKLSERDMMMGIMHYIDRIVTQIVKPKVSVYMAIDGVAPRAKLNQQRSRRFRSAKDMAEANAQQKKELLHDPNNNNNNHLNLDDKVGRWVIKQHCMFLHRQR